MFPLVLIFPIHWKKNKNIRFFFLDRYIAHYFVKTVNLIRQENDTYPLVIATHNSKSSVLLEHELFEFRKGFKIVVQSTPPLQAAIASAICNNRSDSNWQVTFSFFHAYLQSHWVYMVQLDVWTIFQLSGVYLPNFINQYTLRFNQYSHNSFYFYRIKIRIYPSTSTQNLIYTEYS